MLGIFTSSSGGENSTHLVECPSPSSTEEFIQLAKKAKEQLFNLHKNKDVHWKLLQREHDVEIWAQDQDSDGSKANHPLVKTSAILPVPAKVLYKKLWEDDLEKRQEWEPEIMALLPLKAITEDIQVVYRSYKAPYPVASREFVVLNAKCIEEDCYTIYGTSINYEYQHPNSQCVRANAIISGVIIEPLPNDERKCSCVRYVHIDPKGMIPTWVVNLTKKKGIESLIRLQQVLQEGDFNETDDEEFHEIEDHEIFHHEALESANLLNSTPNSFVPKNNIEVHLPSSKSQPLSVEELVVARSKEFPPMNSQMQSSLQAIEVLLKNLQQEVKSSNERLSRLESSLRIAPSFKLGLVSFRWDAILFITLWPIIAYRIYKFLKKLKK